MNLTANEPAPAVEGIEAIALRQGELQASRAAVRRSCETELPRARRALEECRFAIAEGEAGAILRGRRTSVQRAGRASFAPSPTDRQGEATDGGQHFQDSPHARSQRFLDKVIF